ncbi:MAG: hypothetical protein C0598_09030 [Marinilabiliales bacterium]|nr:MAG: hypothetical protein C0598_09030 [Marinilabiliales bacterium]
MVGNMAYAGRINTCRILDKLHIWIKQKNFKCLVMGKNNIENKSFAYNLLYSLLKPWHNGLFYKKVFVLNKRNIPADGKLIFTPNHQNALMDALALLFNIKRQLIFVARADIFKKKSIAAILYFLKILPVYRIRDGFDSLKNNQETFKKTADVLLEGNGLVILPEGNHASSRSLRPLKKGFARIAFQTEVENDFKLGIQIVPVGIDYSNYYKIRETLIVNFGPPIKISDYKDLYEENPPVALNKIREDLSQAISGLMLDIKSKTHYNTYETIRGIYDYKKIDSTKGIIDESVAKFYADQILVKKLFVYETNELEKFELLANQISKYEKKLARKNISLKLFKPEELSFIKTIFNAALNMALLPVYLYSLILNFIPFQLSMASGKILKDKQFQSSFKLVISFLLFPIFYIIETLIIYSLFELPISWYLFIVSQIIASFIAIYIQKSSVTIFQKLRILLIRINNRAYFNELVDQRKSILEKLNKIISI